MTISLRFIESPFMSPRTKKYFESMICEGDAFDYDKWLKRVREDEAEAKQAKSTRSSGEQAAAKVDEPICTPNDKRGGLVPPFQLVTQTARIPGVLRRPCRAKGQTPKARPRRWLERVRRAWGKFQASRKRDAAYGFLEAVFGIVMHYKVRRRTNRLLRHAFEFADLPFDESADTFSAVIRCTCGDGADIKTISKWARALRFVARSKERDSRLRTFMKEAGGVNACANLYAKHFGRGRRRPELLRKT